MSIRVENNLQNGDNKELFDQRVHYIPCKIEDDGIANVTKYLEPFIKSNENGDLSCSFRGHPLDGAKMALPEGYRAILLTEARRPLVDEAHRNFQVAGGFKELIRWNWDKRPSINDNLVKALDWIDIAEAIHGD